jgi:hypothetical protein
LLKHGAQLAGPAGPGQRVDDYRRLLEARRNVRVLHMTSTPPTIADLQSRYCERAVQDQPLLQGFAHPPDGVFHFCPMMARAPGALTGFPMRSQPSLQTGPVAEACDKRLSVGLDEGRDVPRRRNQGKSETLSVRSGFGRKRLLDLTQKTLGAFGYPEPNSVTFMIAERFHFGRPLAGPDGRSPIMPPSEDLGVDFDCLVQRDVHLFHPVRDATIVKNLS